MRFRLAAVLASLCLAAPALAQAGHADPNADTPVDPNAMMEAYAKANAPNENHAKLNNLIGDWDVITRAWMDPSAEPMEMHGKVAKAWTLDGRFIREDLSGDNPMGQYSGVGYLGFDNAIDTYQGMWLSSMSTGMIAYSGKIDDTGKTLVCTGKENDPMTGQTLDFKMTITLDNPDSHTLTFWYVIPGAGEVKAFEMIHTKAAH
ncbi:MAG: DUF1579 family protein [Phycisphaerales bacterium]